MIKTHSDYLATVAAARRDHSRGRKLSAAPGSTYSRDPNYRRGYPAGIATPARRTRIRRAGRRPGPRTGTGFPRCYCRSGPIRSPDDPRYGRRRSAPVVIKDSACRRDNPVPRTIPLRSPRQSGGDLRRTAPGRRRSRPIQIAATDGARRPPEAIGQPRRSPARCSPRKAPTAGPMVLSRCRRTNSPKAGPLQCSRSLAPGRKSISLPRNGGILVGRRYPEPYLYTCSGVWACDPLRLFESAATVYTWAGVQEDSRKAACRIGIRRRDDREPAYLPASWPRTPAIRSPGARDDVSRL